MLKRKKEVRDMTEFWFRGADLQEDLEDLIYENKTQVPSER